MSGVSGMRRPAVIWLALLVVSLCWHRHSFAAEAEPPIEAVICLEAEEPDTSAKGA